jgi:hypothetical protein
MINRIRLVLVGSGLIAEDDLVKFPLLHPAILVEFVEIKQVLVDSSCAVGVLAIGDGVGVVLFFAVGPEAYAGHFAKLVV